MADAERALLVNLLLDRPDEASTLLARLRRFPWDCEEGLALLSRDRLVHALDRFLTGSLSAEQIAYWAEAIEVRDDIATEGFGLHLIREIVAELANPYLAGNTPHAIASERPRDTTSRS